MKLNDAIRFLDMIKNDDDVFKNEKKKTAGTWCSECKQNKAVGLHPFWHRYRRELCDKCAKEYHKLLHEIGAYDPYDY